MANDLIFISYASKDRNKVLKIYDYIANAGYSPWMDCKDIIAGEDWKRAITVAIENSAAFLAIVSKNSIDRRGVLQVEINYALNQWEGYLPDDIYIIPVRLDSSLLPERINKFQAIKWYSSTGKQKLVDAIGIALSKR